MVAAPAGGTDSGWTVHGRIASASNAVVLVEVDAALHVYKPTAGEAPLWDFPGRSLGRRELAVAAIDDRLGWGLVPPTRWVDDGPHGPGTLQRWIDHDPADGPVRLVPAEAVPDAAVVVATGHGSDGEPVALIHEDSGDLLRIAVFDAMVNNADRKGGHILRDGAGRLWCIDHGLCLHGQPKLRTVLWGFAGRVIPHPLVADLEALGGDIPELAVGFGLADDEVQALVRRTAQLVRTGVLPLPDGGRPALPWPPL
jgi:uncharacterized repeat protein (TIGR03843 family)